MTIYNRAHLLEKTLESFARQSFPKEDYEIVIVDDQSTDNISELLDSYKGILQIQHIVMDRSLSHYPVKANCPALGLNIGFRQARADIIFKTDPEMYQVGETLQIAYDTYDPLEMTFGAAYWLNEYYTKIVGRIDDESLVEVGEKGNDPDIKPLVAPSLVVPLYFISVMSRNAILAIHGVDEQFMSGIACDDDDFAERMQIYGCTWNWNFNIKGLHQYHGPIWFEQPGKGVDSDLYKHNRQILEDRISPLGRSIINRPVKNFAEMEPEDRFRFALVNKGHDWGNAIVSKRII